MASPASLTLALHPNYFLYLPRIILSEISGFFQVINIMSLSFRTTKFSLHVIP